jgi:catechol-2,3-dioxygenase
MMVQVVDVMLTIGSDQLENLVEFYSALLGCSPTAAIPAVYAEFQVPGARLGIFRPKTPYPLPTHQPPTRGMALCLEVEDLSAAIAHLTALGYPPPGAIITASHGQEIYAYDPDGNGLILHQKH